jgi:hypothetical protein
MADVATTTRSVGARARGGGGGGGTPEMAAVSVAGAGAGAVVSAVKVVLTVMLSPSISRCIYVGCVGVDEG